VTDEDALLIDVGAMSGRDRYRLLTSLVVPRPIAWVSTWSAARAPNLAPFSYYAMLSANPALVGVSVGDRRGVPKDTLVNVRETGAFCVNVVTEPHLEAMNRTSEDVGPDVDEFALAGLAAVPANVVDAPRVSSAPAVLECLLRQEVPLQGSGNTLIVGEVVAVRLAPGLHPAEAPAVDGGLLGAVGRLGGTGYQLPGPVRDLPRP